MTGAPAFTSAASDTVPSGSAFTYSVTTSGTPTPTIELNTVSTLPSGVTLTDNGNGTATLAGTTAVAPGIYIFGIGATNGITPNATQAFTLTVTKAPAFTSAASDTVTAGSAFTYSVTTTGTPTPAITLASGSTLPQRGDADRQRERHGHLGRHHGGGQRDLHLQHSGGQRGHTQCHPGLHAEGEPGDQGPRLHQRGQRHRDRGHRLHLFGDHHRHTHPGHHPGHGFDPAERGDADRQRERHRHLGRHHGGGRGTYTFSIQAANGVSPNATQAFTLKVNAATKAPAFTSAASDTVTAGSAFTYSVTTTGTPTPAITLASGSSLPKGVTLTDNKNGTATLAGTTAVVAGTYKFTLQAANGVTPNATQAFTLTVNAAKTRRSPSSSPGPSPM